MLFNQLKHEKIGRHITLVRHLIHYTIVQLIVLIKMIMPNIKKSVFPKAIRLMNLEIEANGRHLYTGGLVENMIINGYNFLRCVFPCDSFQIAVSLLH